MDELVVADRDATGFPLTSAQRRMWFAESVSPEAGAYNVVSEIRWAGELVPEALRTALRGVVARHEVLRTVFTDAPAQVVRPEADIDCVADVDRVVDDGELRAVILAEGQRGFSLDESLFRVRVLRTGVDEFAVLFVVHHLVFDGWSAGVLVRDLVALYREIVDGVPAELPALSVRVVDHAVWERSEAGEAVVQEQLGYWLDYLADAPSVLPLVAERPRADTGRMPDTFGFSLDSSTVQSLAEYARVNAATSSMVLLSVLSVVLSRRAGVDDVLVGMPVWGRQGRSAEGVLGCFANTVVVRVRPEWTGGFDDVLDQVCAGVIDGMDHQAVPFDRLVEEVRPERRAGHHPLFQVMYSYERRSRKPLTGNRFEVHGPSEALQADTGCDLDITVVDFSDEVAVSVRFDASLFGRDSVGRLSDEFRAVLGAVLAGTDACVGELPMLSDAARRSLLDQVSKGAGIAIPDVPLHGLFEYWATLEPERIAVACGDTELTYGEVNARANRLAHELRSLGVGPDVLVAVGLPRSADLMVALLGVLKAGGAFAPVDPGQPRDRITRMTTRAGIRFGITTTGTGDIFGDVDEVIRIDRPGPGRFSDRNQDVPLSAGNLAYVFHTSGSTGEPKGAMCTHGNAVSFAVAAVPAFGLVSGDRFLQLAAATFDVLVEEVFPVWTAGGAVVLADQDLSVLTPEAFLDLLARRGITACELPAAYWTVLVDHLDHGEDRLPELFRLLLVGTERVDPDVWSRWRDHGRTTVNVYGLTETSVTSTCLRDDGVTDFGGGEVPIGRPFPNATVYIVDAFLNPVPIGVVGEVYLGGPGTGRGYVNQPALTAERFVPDPFGQGGRLYRTGDRARWTSAGEVVFCGRSDDQLKIRGHRIEPGEIENVLERHQDVTRAFVTTRTDVGGQQHLDAYVAVRDLGVTVVDLVRHAAARLPAHMVPATVTVLDRLPVTPHGKIDRAALPTPTAHASVADRPLTPVEERLAALWCELLGVTAVGPQDNFFQLGGHSLLTYQLVARIRQVLGADIALSDFFADPTIAGTAALLATQHDRGPRPSRDVLAADRGAEGFPLSSAQRRMWFVERAAPDSGVHNVVCEIRWVGALEQDGLRAALSRLVARHEALRTVFTDGPLQVVLPGTQVECVIDVERALDDAELRGVAAEEGRRGFRLDEGVFRVRVVRVGVDEFVLLLVVHHLVFDGWSAGVVVRDLVALYREVVDGIEAGLPELPVQVVDHAVWERGADARQLVREQLGYWLDHLAGAPELLPLPQDRALVAELAAGGVHEFTVDGRLHRRMVEYARVNGVTPSMVLLSVLSVLLSRRSGAEDLVVGMPVWGRGGHALEDVVGCFVNTVVVRVRPEWSGDFGDVLEQVRAGVVNALDHQDVPFDRLVEELRPERLAGRHPVFQIMFSYEQGDRTPIVSGDVTVHPPETRFTATEFDLDVTVLDFPEEAVVSVQFDPELFDLLGAQRFSDEFRVVLDAVTAGSTLCVGELPLLSENARLTVVEELSRGAQTAVPNLPLHGSFEEWAAREPSRIAIGGAFGELTYGEVNARANRLAHELRSLGVGPDVCVVVCLDRSAELMVALLGVLKAGGAFVPVDPGQPQDRIAGIIHRSGARVLVTKSGHRDLVAGAADVVEIDRPGAGAFGDDDPDVPLVAGNLAYVFHTSGSTGEPKGAMCTHGNAVSFAVPAVAVFGLSPEDRFLQLAAVTFDVLVEEVFPVWAAGGAVVLADRDLAELTPAAFLDLLARQGITACELPVAYWAVLVDHLERAAETLPEPFRLLLVGGERIDPDVWLKWRDHGGSAINVYGLTETSVTNVYLRDDRVSGFGGEDVPIGKPYPNGEVYILDRLMNPVPIGVTGELYLGGPGIGRGYLNQPGLTADRFVPDPFGLDARLYRTGDRARWLSTGDIAFHGRTDHQLKIRGHRIEPGEIENALERHPEVTRAFVTARTDAHGQHLDAYVAVHGTATGTDLLQHAAAKLPAHMVPNTMTVLSRLPVTSHGKIDRAALPAPVTHSGVHDRPLTPVEERVAALWFEVLEVSAGPHDNFFRLGGHSLLTYQLIARIREEFDREVSLAEFFGNPTVAHLAGLLTADHGAVAEVDSGGEVSLEDLLDEIERRDA
ncbi:non-ribosomal peptide synthetase [Lentzea albidocapillata]|uniref:Amino acid adenylation domain-containing protein n=1 Tax=Lentzea albidocapillata TaxID=40571 RepID=A0A1W2CUM3_9PSEU|nr:non-ribosomal peptide synthetase [Lentzea albidocapillata]SMC88949.1 amino acid adenylation domain-containing protein [Lentzea albidocapillata]